MDGLPTQKTVYAFAYNPKNPKMMYAALREGLFSSDDEGKRWSHLKTGPKGTVALAIDPKDPAKIFAGKAQGKVFLSIDSGRTWKPQSK